MGPGNSGAKNGHVSQFPYYENTGAQRLLSSGRQLEVLDLHKSKSTVCAPIAVAIFVAAHWAQ
jgi:hypothetical protein